MSRALLSIHCGMISGNTRVFTDVSAGAGCENADMDSMSSHRRLTLALAGLVGVEAVVLVGLLLRGVTPPADAWIVHHLYAPAGSPVAAVATAVSGVGTLLGLAALLVGAVLVWWRGRARSTGLLLRVLAVAVTSGSVLLLQNLILRPGPPQQPQLGTYPSGHATVLTAIVVAAVLLYGTLGKAWRRGALIGGGAAIVLVSASRMVLAEHWLIDIVAAIVATTCVGLVAAAALRLPLDRLGGPVGGL
jgi:membrane-associated phospholipid phosphatase